MKENKGITLIALVITIIILLILAGVGIAMLTGDNGLFKRAKEAKEKTEISAYHEQIEIIRAELCTKNENYTLPTLVQLQEEFDTNQKEWVKNTEIKLVKDIETLVLTTKEGYIFHITESDTKYMGREGEEVDISELEEENVVKLEIVGDATNGKLVKVSEETGKYYYTIEYQIDGTEGEWTSIGSGKTVEVNYGSTIYARLAYEINKGKISSLKIDKIFIGDYVNYTPYTQSGNYWIQSNQSGYSEDQHYSIETDLKWRVFSINNDKVTLISNKSTEFNYGLGGEIGYNNGVKLLNNVGALYSNDSKNAIARSIKIEDILSVIDTKKWDYSKWTGKASYGDRRLPYGSVWHYERSEIDYDGRSFTLPRIFNDQASEVNKINGVLVNGTLGESEQNNSYSFTGMGSKPNSLDIQSTYFTQAVYSYFNSADTRDLSKAVTIYRNELLAGEYWIASRFTEPQADQWIWFGLRHVTTNVSIGCSELYATDTDSQEHTYPIRIMVEIPLDSIDIRFRL